MGFMPVLGGPTCSSEQLTDGGEPHSVNSRWGVGPLEMWLMQCEAPSSLEVGQPCFVGCHTFFFFLPLPQMFTIKVLLSGSAVCSPKSQAGFLLAMTELINNVYSCKAHNICISSVTDLHLAPCLQSQTALCTHRLWSPCLPHQNQRGLAMAVLLHTTKFRIRNLT